MKPDRIPLARGGFLELGGRRHVMGVVNLTPDSFWEGSRSTGPDDAAARAVDMVRNGASVLDLGGESTRPGSAYVAAGEELLRVVPAVRAIREALDAAGLDAAISVDTRKAAVARAALDAGADIVNDVAALRHDPELAPLCAARGVPVVLMHMRGDPDTMQAAPAYADVVAEVAAFLAAAARDAEAAGIARDRIILDPGIGFGKRLEDNLALVARLDELAALGYPLLVGLSRKSFVGALTGRAPAGRLAGTLGATCAAWIRGADIFRVHDVAETVDAITVLAACLGAEAAAGGGERP